MTRLFFLICFIQPACMFLAAQSSGILPGSAGMSAERLTRIDKTVQEYIDKKWLNGAVALIFRDGKPVYYKAFGYDDAEKRTPMQKEEIFRIASQTKAITSVAIMILYENGRLLLDDPVSKYISTFKNPQVLANYHAADTTYTTVPANREVTIRDLFTHTS
jgi:CubicO group peptidase (beta-lactamase class C family)